MTSPEEWQVHYYRTADGRVPYREWRDALRDRQAAAAIEARLGRLKLGLLGDCRPVGEGVLELRVHVGPGYRVYFLRAGAKVVVLLCGGDKRSQASDIRTAKRYRRDYDHQTHGSLGSG